MGVGKAGSAEAGRGAAKQGRQPFMQAFIVSAKKRVGRGRHVVMKNQVGKLVGKGYQAGLQAGQSRQQLNRQSRVGHTHRQGKPGI